MVLKTVRFVNLVLTALVAGLLFRDVVSSSATRQLSGSTYIHYQQALNQTMSKRMPPIFLSTTFTALLVLLLSGVRRPTNFGLNLVGLGCDVGMIVSTIRVNEPLNKQIDTWSADVPPGNWAEVRERWLQGHNLRTGIGIAGLICQLLAGLNIELAAKAGK